eukprot:740628-Hanusia_phi.AAC.1
MARVTGNRGVSLQSHPGLSVKPDPPPGESRHRGSQAFSASGHCGNRDRPGGATALRGGSVTRPAVS